MNTSGEQVPLDGSGESMDVPADFTPGTHSGRSGTARKRLRALVLAAAVLIVLAGGATYFLTHHQHDRPAAKSQAPVIWQTSDKQFSGDDRRGIDDALAVALKSGKRDLAGGSRSGYPEFLVINAERAGPWAALSLAVRANPSNVVTAAEPIFFIAERQKAGWKLTFPGSALFCKQLHQVPAKMLGPADIRYFGC